MFYGPLRRFYLGRNTVIKLYDYFFSGAAYRTRIALNLKGLDYEQQAVHLTKDGGEQFQKDYDDINPQNLVPTLLDGDLTFFQSMAIMEYLEETYAEPPLLPRDHAGRARVRALANIVACDTHPLNNLRVRLYLAHEIGLSEKNQNKWIEHWIYLGLGAYEKVLQDGTGGPYSHGAKPGLADACLVPQVANAKRNKVDLSAFPSVLKVVEACNALPAFQKALPANQPDAP